MSRADGSGVMFDGIAGRYDMLNRVLSLGLDQSWRRHLIDTMAPAGDAELLDLATGTADVALMIADTRPAARIVGVDPSRGMLEVGRAKVTAAGLDSRITLEVGDGQQLPFEDRRFDGACIAFGIRNVPDRARCLAEMARVCRVGATVGVLELGEPRDGPLASLARFHVRRVVPRIGAVLSGSREYAYLQSSVAAFPPPDAFAAMMAAAGLRDVNVRRLTFGAAHIYSGVVG